MQLDQFLEPRSANHQALTPLQFLWRTADRHPEKTAVIDGERMMCWREFAAFIRRFAGALQLSGVEPGDVVSMLAPNGLEVLAAHYAVPMIGGVLNTINTRLDAASVAYILDHAQSKVLIAHPSCQDAVERGVREHALAIPLVWLQERPAVTAASKTFAEFFADASALDESAITDEWQPICLNYTSGTTGRPKGVVYHHRGAFLNALGNVLALGFNEHTRYLWVLPMFHCNGWSHTWAVTAAGGTHICMDRADAGQILKNIAAFEVTHMSCAPVVLYMLTAEPSFRDLRLTAPLKVATGGASPTPKLIADLEQKGISLTHLYGLTESYGPATFCTAQDEWISCAPAQRAIRLARQGVPHPTAGEAMVVDGTGAATPCDGKTIGEIVLRGNTLMAGYYRDAKATENAFADGVFHTGDLAVRHADGHIQICDRAKDIIIAGGENIASIEIEGVLHQHPAVLLAAVVAMPDEKWGELPCAFVEFRSDAPWPSEAELIRHCRERLAHFKTPRRIIVGEIPRTATGKVQKYLLREHLCGARNACGCSGDQSR